MKGNVKKVLDGIDKVVTSLNSIVLVVAIAVMFLLVFANVIGRYFFQQSIKGANELAQYLMISVAFLGMGMAMRKGQHSAFSIVQDAVPNKVRLALRVVVSVILLAIMAVLVYLGTLYAFKYMGNRTEMLRMPVGLWYLTIPVGAGLFIFHFLFGLKDYVLMPKNAELEAEIAAGEALTGQSELLKESADKKEGE